MGMKGLPMSSDPECWCRKALSASLGASRSTGAIALELGLLPARRNTDFVYARSCANLVRSGSPTTAKCDLGKSSWQAIRILSSQARYDDRSVMREAEVDMGPVVDGLGRRGQNQPLLLQVGFHGNRRFTLRLA
jgi:hypothetical protein